jgi:DNA adenine methylase
MSRNELLKPFVKWAGGKRQLLKEISKYAPGSFNQYFEPFLGGAAVLLHLQPRSFIVNDINTEMINVYQTIKENVDELLNELKEYRNEKEFFYKVREYDRNPHYHISSPIKKAARIIYLNKTCFNGLFRVNSRGYFNVPFGDYKNPDFINEKTLRAVSEYFNSSKGVFLNGDFEAAVETAKKGDFIYFDPPYDPLSNTSSFTSYTLAGFGKNEQERLKYLCDNLHKQGCSFLLSNSSTEYIHKLYHGYKIEIVRATRNINSVGSARGAVDEVLIRNY